MKDHRLYHFIVTAVRIVFFMMFMCISNFAVAASGASSTTSGVMSRYLDKHSHEIRQDLGLIYNMSYRRNWREAYYGLQRLAVKIAASVPQGTWMKQEQKRRLEAEVKRSVSTMNAFITRNHLEHAAGEAAKWTGRELETQDMLTADLGYRLWSNIADIWEKTRDPRAESARLNAYLFQNPDKRIDWGWQGRLNDSDEPDERIGLIDRELYGHIVARENRLPGRLQQMASQLEFMSPDKYSQGDPFQQAISLFWPVNGYLRAVMTNGIQNELVFNRRMADFRAMLNNVGELKIYDSRDISLDYLQSLLLAYNGRWIELSSFAPASDHIARNINSSLSRDAMALFKTLLGTALFASGDYNEGITNIRSGAHEGRHNESVQFILNALYDALGRRSNVEREIYNRMIGYDSEESSITIRELETRFPGGIELDRRQNAELRRRILRDEIEEISRKVALKNHVIPEPVVMASETGTAEEMAEEKAAAPRPARPMEEGPPITITQFLIMSLLTALALLVWIYLSQFEFNIWKRPVSSQSVFERGRNMMEAGKYKEALKKLELLDHMTLLDEEESDLEYMRALCYRALEDNIEAIVCCKKALKFAKRDDALKILGEIYHESEEYSINSKDVFEYLEKTDSKRTEWTAALARVYRNTKKYDENSLRVFRNWRRLKGDDEEVLKDIAMCIVELKYADKLSEKFMRELKTEYTGHVEIQLLWCKYLQNAAKYDELVDAARNGMKLDTENISFHLLFRDAYRKLDNIDGLVSSYRELCERYPKSTRMKEKLKEAQNLKIVSGASGQEALEISSSGESVSAAVCSACGASASFSDLICGKCGSSLI